MDYKKKYSEALERAKECHVDGLALHQPVKDVLEYIFPELKESEDEMIRKAIIEHFAGSHSSMYPYKGFTKEQFLVWLEKQGQHKRFRDSIQIGDSVTKNEYDELVNLSQLNRVAKRDADILKKQSEQKSTTIDVDKMVSDYASHNEKRNEIFGKPVPCMVRAYKQGICDTLESLGEEKPFEKEFTFKAIPRLLDMIEPSDRAKAYCQKLIDTLAKEGYNTDAKIVEGVLKGRNGEDVPMAVMDEKQGEQKPSDEDMKEALRTEYEKGRADAIAEMEKPTWSDEDVYNSKLILSTISQDQDLSLKTKDKLTSWIKSIKQRIGG